MPSARLGIYARVGSTQTVVVCEWKQISARNYVEPCIFNAAVDAKVNRFCDAFFALGVKRRVRTVGGQQLCGNVNGRENSAGTCTGQELTRDKIEPRVAIRPTGSVICPCGVAIGQCGEGVSCRAGCVLLISGHDARCCGGNARIEIAEVRSHHCAVGKAALQFNPGCRIPDSLSGSRIGEVDVVVAWVEVKADFIDAIAFAARGTDDVEQIG